MVMTMNKDYKILLSIAVLLVIVIFLFSLNDNRLEDEPIKDTESYEQIQEEVITPIKPSTECTEIVDEIQEKPKKVETEESTESEQPILEVELQHPSKESKWQEGIFSLADNSLTLNGYNPTNIKLSGYEIASNSNVVEIHGESGINSVISINETGLAYCVDVYDDGVISIDGLSIGKRIEETEVMSVLSLEKTGTDSYVGVSDTGYSFILSVDNDMVVSKMTLMYQEVQAAEQIEQVDGME